MTQYMEPNQMIEYREEMGTTLLMSAMEITRYGEDKSLVITLKMLFLKKEKWEMMSYCPVQEMTDYMVVMAMTR